MKLDNGALVICKRLQSEGYTQPQIASDLTSRGYTQAKGGKLTQSDISIFMLKHGIRRNGPYLKGNNRVVAQRLQQQQQISQQQSNQIQSSGDADMIKLILNNSNLTKSKKLKLLEVLI